MAKMTRILHSQPITQDVTGKTIYKKNTEEKDFEVLSLHGRIHDEEVDKRIERINKKFPATLCLKKKFNETEKMYSIEQNKNIIFKSPSIMNLTSFLAGFEYAETFYGILITRGR